MLKKIINGKTSGGRRGRAGGRSREGAAVSGKPASGYSNQLKGLPPLTS